MLDASQTVSAVTQMTNQIETQNKLTHILQGNRLDCRISGSDPLSPFVLRSGFWLITNYEEVKQYIDYGEVENVLRFEKYATQVCRGIESKYKQQTVRGPKH